jgi:hypothetical protein
MAKKLKLRISLRRIRGNLALELLCKHLGMFVDSHEHTGKDGGSIETVGLSPLEGKADYIRAGKRG